METIQFNCFSFNSITILNECTETINKQPNTQFIFQPLSQTKHDHPIHTLTRLVFGVTKAFDLGLKRIFITADK